jgi:hypothetical protein
VANDLHLALAHVGFDLLPGQIGHRALLQVDRSLAVERKERIKVSFQPLYRALEGRTNLVMM